jgi:hypothetical protein
MADHSDIPHASPPGEWRKSSYSNSEGGSCLEVLDAHPAGVPVRDSKCADGPALLFSPCSWSTFVAALGRRDG